MQADIHIIPSIPLPLPEHAVLSRLGCHHHLSVVTADQQSVLRTHMNAAFAACRPFGVWRMLEVAEMDADHVVLTDGSEFVSRALATLLQGSTAVWLAAASVGAALPAAVHRQCDEQNGVAALVYDAVGSETADAAMDWLQQFCRRELCRRGLALAERRFSPGYSDLALTAQRTIFTLLGLENQGLQLTESLLIVPEKSVTALAGIRQQQTP